MKQVPSHSLLRSAHTLGCRGGRTSRPCCVMSPGGPLPQITRKSNTSALWLNITRFLIVPALLFSLASPAQAFLMKSGSYAGDATANRDITDVGFEPDFVIVKGDNGRPAVARSSTMSGDNSKQLAASGPFFANRIQGFVVDGFQVGNDADGTSYYWVAFKINSAEMKVGTYVGDNVDDRSIAVGFPPDYLVVMSEESELPFKRTSAVSGDRSFKFASGNPQANRIQAFEANGFQIGDNNDVNDTGVTYHYVALKG